MPTIYLDFNVDATNANDVELTKMELKDDYNLDVEILPRHYDNAKITGTKADIINFLLDDNGYCMDMEWIKEFFPELLEDN